MDGEHWLAMRDGELQLVDAVTTLRTGV